MHRLRELRKQNNYKKKDIANYLNCSKKKYSDYENCKCEIPVEVIIKLADFYNTSMDYILYLTDNSIFYN